MVINVFDPNGQANKTLFLAQSSSLDGPTLLSLCPSLSPLLSPPPLSPSPAGIGKKKSFSTVMTVVSQPAPLPVGWSGPSSPGSGSNDRVFEQEE